MQRWMLLIAVACLAAIGLAGLGGAQEDAAPGAEVQQELMLFVVELEPGPGWLEGKPVFEQPLMEHARYHSEIFEQGQLYMGGPYLDDAGGLVILQTTDLESAQKLVDDDPAVRDGIFTARIHPYMAVFNQPEGVTWTPPAAE